MNGRRRLIVVLALALSYSMLSSATVASAGPLGTVTPIAEEVDGYEDLSVHRISPNGGIVVFGEDPGPRKLKSTSFLIARTADGVVHGLTEGIDSGPFGKPIEISEDETTIAFQTQFGAVYLWTEATGSVLVRDVSPDGTGAAPLQIAADGSLLLMRRDDTRYELYSSDGGSTTLPANWRIPKLSGDGSRIAHLTSAVRSGDAPASVEVSRSSDLSSVVILGDGTDQVQKMVFSADGEAVVWRAVDSDGNESVLRWSAATGEINIGRGLAGAFLSPVALSTDGETIVLAASCCGGPARTIYHYLWRNGVGARRMNGSFDNPSLGSLSADGSLIARTVPMSGSAILERDGRATLLQGPSGSAITRATVAPDGRTVVLTVLGPGDKTGWYVWADLSIAESIDQVVASQAYDEKTDPEVLRLYRAFFKREPDVPGAVYWLDIRDEHSSLEIARAFTKASAEFEITYKDADDNQVFLDRVYQNVLGRAPDPVGRTYWLDALNGTNASTKNPDLMKLDRGTVIYYIALGEEFISRYPYLPHS